MQKSPRARALSSLALISGLCAAAPAVRADVKLPTLFSDHMVLQRDVSVPVWGWADPGEQVSVSIANQTKTVTADANGKWMVRLDKLQVGAPQTLTVKGKNTLTVQDVLVGEVWVASGQSNMEFTVGGGRNAAQEIADSEKYPQIRQFYVPHNPIPNSVDDVKNGKWQSAGPKTTGGFTAVGYFFARELYNQLKVPIGIVHSSFGGTPAEAWTRLSALNTVPELKTRAEAQFASMATQDEDNKRFVTDLAAWEEKYGVKDPENQGAKNGWAAADLNTADWKEVTLPSNWKNLGQTTGGVFWIRKEFDVPAENAGKAFNFMPGNIANQYDVVYLNGQEIGRAQMKSPQFNFANRYYWVSGDKVKAGRNVIAIRIAARTPDLAFSQPGNMMGLPVADPKAVDNKWLFKVESSFPAVSGDALKELPKPNATRAQDVAAYLNNGMIVPLVPYAIKGTIWYQGESNSGNAKMYRTLFPMMIQDWRQQWGQGDFPFYFVQLANYMAVPQSANDGPGWADLRQAQTLTLRKAPNTGMATIIDIGEANDIHPKNKQDVGYRLAQIALAKDYGRNIEYSGPVFDSMTVQGNQARLKFTHAKSGLVAKGGPLQRFAIAGPDKKFVWADAKIEGDTIVVSSPEVTAPTVVRYAWSNNPEGANLYNAEGLPAVPFTTDEP